jgi:hypothetical protein
MPAFSEWESFYVIVGSSAGALIGLQFVVITLMADTPNVRDMKRASSAFSTPNIVHFGAVLLLSAFVAAPWRGFAVVEDLWGALGISGVLYSFIVARRMRVQTAYKPEFEDWLFHALLPFAAYATLVGSAYASRLYVEKALFGVGATALLLLFIGIHNAWDAVTYQVTVVKPGQAKPQRRR